MTVILLSKVQPVMNMIQVSKPSIMANAQQQIKKKLGGHGYHTVGILV